MYSGKRSEFKVLVVLALLVIFLGFLVISSVLGEGITGAVIGKGKDPLQIENTLMPSASSECNDGVDNDGDGYTDYPLDISCQNSSDNENDKSGLINKTWSYSWHGNYSNNPLNIVPFAFLYTNSYCTNTMNHTWGDNCSTVVDLINATNQMPEGHKVVFDHLLYETPSNESFRQHYLDNCVDSEGNLTDFRCIWWDNAVNATIARYDDFFQNFSNQSGEIDTLVLDIERGLSHWSIKVMAAEDGKSVVNYFQAIENDSRFPDIADLLGFSNLSTISENWNVGDEYRIWWGVMQDRVIDYYNEAIYDVVKKYYPNVAMGNYNNYYLGFGDRNGFIFQEYVASNLSIRTNGSHMGTFQSPYLYTTTPLNQSYDGQVDYAETPFNDLRFQLNNLRDAKLSNGSVPLYPWIANKKSELLLLQDNDYYQEFIFHTILTGPEKLLFFNPYHISGGSDTEEDILFSNLTTRADYLVGFNDKTTLVDNLSWWGDDYVLSGMSAGGKKVWRFTPELNQFNVINDTLFSSEGDIVFQTHKKKITIPGGYIFKHINGSYSENGYWIIQNASSADPVIEPAKNICRNYPSRCISTLPDNQIAYWNFNSDFSDNSSNNHGGINGSDVYINQSEGINGVAVFTGGGNTITVPHDEVFNLVFDKNISISFWVKPSTDSTQIILEKNGSKKYYYRLLVLNNKSYFGVNNAVGNWTTANSIDIAPDKWNFITYVKDNNTIYSYLNGTLITTTTSSIFSDNTSNTGDITIGSTALGTLPLNGSLDELVIFNFSLTPKQVVDIYLMQDAILNVCNNDGVCDLIENVTNCPTDCDIDNDGLRDPDESLVGNSSNVANNFDNLTLEVNSSTNITQNFTGRLNITFKENDVTRMEFSFNFTQSRLTLSDINITKQASTSSIGSIVITGLDLTSQSETKTAYIDRIANYSGLCIKDVSSALVANITSPCNAADETSINCPGTAGQYTCTINGSYYQLEGLNHSAVKEYTPPTTESPGGGGSSTSLICQTGAIQCINSLHYQECLKYRTTNKWSDLKDVPKGYQCRFGKIVELEIEEAVKEKEQLPPAQPQPTEETIEEVKPSSKVWKTIKSLSWLWTTLLITIILLIVYFFMKKNKH